jgi:hypothetical protein
MPRPHPPEFRERAVELARERAKPIDGIAEDLGISSSCLRNWVRLAEIDRGDREGLSTEESAELVRLPSRESGVADGEGDPGKSRGILASTLPARDPPVDASHSVTYEGPATPSPLTARATLATLPPTRFPRSVTGCAAR